MTCVFVGKKYYNYRAQSSTRSPVVADVFMEKFDDIALETSR